MGKDHARHQCARARCPGRVAISWPIASADGIICINMVHISPWEAIIRLIEGTAAIRPAASPVYLYGTHTREGLQRPPEQSIIRPKPSRSQSGLESARLRSGQLTTGV